MSFITVDPEASGQPPHCTSNLRSLSQPLSCTPSWAVADLICAVHPKWNWEWEGHWRVCKCWLRTNRRSGGKNPSYLNLNSGGLTHASCLNWIIGVAPNRVTTEELITGLLLADDCTLLTYTEEAWYSTLSTASLSLMHPRISAGTNPLHEKPTVLLRSTLMELTSVQWNTLKLYIYIYLPG